MRKYFNRATIIIFLIFIFQSLNVAFCLTHQDTHQDIDNFATYFAIVADVFIFILLCKTLINSK